jgi:hypothetical protein
MWRQACDCSSELFDHDVNRLQAINGNLAALVAGRIR